MSTAPPRVPARGPLRTVRPYVPNTSSLQRVSFEDSATRAKRELRRSLPADFHLPMREDAFDQPQKEKYVYPYLPATSSRIMPKEILFSRKVEGGDFRLTQRNMPSELHNLAGVNQELLNPRAGYDSMSAAEIMATFSYVGIHDDAPADEKTNIDGVAVCNVVTKGVVTLPNIWLLNPENGTLDPGMTVGLLWKKFIVIGKEDVAGNARAVWQIIPYSYGAIPPGLREIGGGDFIEIGRVALIKCQQRSNLRSTAIKKYLTGKVSLGSARYIPSADFAIG